ncbi:putative Ankyrin repeats (3 copies) [Trypanosoma vivax]|uniref:Uncharacterized protein n=1 Tax=Trypanosoma vivax (strain Y486) TaxID=1055687 RepID=G0TT70_TRYVY|nr:putative Ankyrin repeats (3 copies) [Trypanosoma vivax]CCC47151.1 conserved hypothetical protein [Trypanosoma vivax Y486]
MSLSEEERAAKEARLGELRAQMERLANPSTDPPHDGDGSDCQAYEGEDGSQSSGNSADEEFLASAENAVGVCMFATPMGELLGKTVETGPNAKRGIIGDFELLRLAKMGDLVSFKEFAMLTGADPTTFKDNHGRNALHYAADSGSVSVLQYLSSIGVPYSKDEKNMTPVDIAALNGHVDCVKLLAETYSQAAESVKDYEEALEEFAVPPPRFTMSKPAPPFLGNTKNRTFWKEPGINADNDPSLIPAAGVSISSLKEEEHQSVAEALCGMGLTQDGHGFYAWLPPTEPKTLAAALTRATLVGATQTIDGRKVLRGVVMSVPLGGLIILRSSSSGQAFRNPRLGALLALHPSLRGANHSSRMLMEMHRLLRDTGGPIVFRSPIQLPMGAVGLIKWFRRSIAPSDVFKRHYATEVFPDFFQYDDVLRVDVVTKNALTKSFVADAGHGSAWIQVEHNDSDQIKRLHEFVSNHAPSAFDVAYIPETSDDLLASIVQDGLSAFVKASPQGGPITDIVVLRLRSLEERPGVTKNAAALCVYALFTSFNGAKKAEEVLALAHKLGYETVFIPNTFGFVDSDLSKAMFEELPSYREYLYALNETISAAIVPTPLSKVALPALWI